MQSSVISPQYVFYKPWEARGGGKDGGGSAPPPPGGYPGFPYIMFGDGLQAVKVRPTRSPSSTTTICSGHASFQDSPFFFRAYAIDRLPIDAHFDFALLHAYVSVLHESPRGLSSRFASRFANRSPDRFPSRSKVEKSNNSAILLRGTMVNRTYGIHKNLYI